MPAAELASKVVPGTELSPGDIAAWRALCEKHGSLRSPFFSVEYVQSVARCRPFVYVCIMQDHAQPLAFFPFQFRSGWHRQVGAAERVGEELTDHFGLIADPRLVLDSSTLLRMARLTHFYFTHLDEGQLAHGLPGEKPQVGLSVRLDSRRNYWEELGRRNGKLVGDTERRLRQLEKAYGPLQFRFIENEWRKPLEQLLDHKRQQYARTGAKDSLAEPWKWKLLETLAASASENCRGVVSILHAGDTWIASHFGLRNRNLLHYWFPVYNVELRRYSPGRLLLKSILESAPQFGIDTVDRGMGDSEAKRAFSNASQLYYRGVWHRLSVRSIIYRVVCSIRWRAGPGQRSQPALASD